MKLVSHLQPVGPALYITPLLNTVMLLLVFFFLGKGYLVESGVAVTLPESSSRLSGFQKAHVISLPPGPDAIAFFDGKQVTMPQLKLALEADLAGERHVIIHADRLASYGRVMEINELAIGLGYEVAQATTPPH